MLKIKNVYKEFNLTGNIEDLRIALDNVSLEVPEGQFVTVIGGNGSGKSTLMNIISGVFPPDRGSVEIAGKDVSKLAEYQRAVHLGRVFQDPNQGTAGNMSIIENMEIAARRNRKKNLSWGFKKENKAKFQEALKELNLGLDTRLESKVGLLSGGQRQALTLLMATLQKPDVLLLDEHTAALDPKTSHIVLQLTEKLVRENNQTTIMITHNMRDAITYGDRLIMLHGGHILYDVSGEEKKNLTPDMLLNLFEKADKLAEQAE